MRQKQFFEMAKINCKIWKKYALAKENIGRIDLYN